MRGSQHRRLVESLVSAQILFLGLAAQNLENARWQRENEAMLAVVEGVIATLKSLQSFYARDSLESLPARVRDVATETGRVLGRLTLLDGALGLDFRAKISGDAPKNALQDLYMSSMKSLASAAAAAEVIPVGELYVAPVGWSAELQRDLVQSLGEAVSLMKGHREAWRSGEGLPTGAHRDACVKFALEVIKLLRLAVNKVLQTAASGEGLGDVWELLGKADALVPTFVISEQLEFLEAVKQTVHKAALAVRSVVVGMSDSGAEVPVYVADMAEHERLVSAYFHCLEKL
jgi:hypothetical protein